MFTRITFFVAIVITLATALKPPVETRVSRKVIIKKPLINEKKIDPPKNSNNERYSAELDYPSWSAEYWRDPRIHGFGNQGFPGGAFHAFVAPFFTKILDLFAYGNIDVRTEAWKLIQRNAAFSPMKSIVDIGCGTGTSSRTLMKADFANEQTRVLALDTSFEMLSAAKILSTSYKNLQYECANAESTKLPSSSFDLAVLAYLMHECPGQARRNILDEALRLLMPGGTLAILDIHPEYTPSNFMLPGEPYINGYLDFFEAEDLRSFYNKHLLRFASTKRDVIVPNRLVLWQFTLRK